MGVSDELKQILACPQCKGALEFHDDLQQIHCRSCRLAYRIDDGIPVMLVDQAQPLE